MLIIMGAWQDVSDQWIYGSGRITRLEAHFGHGDRERPTVVLALDEDGQIEVIELPGGNGRAVRTYQLGEIVSPQNTPAVIRLQTKETTRDGLLDLVVTPEGASPFVLYNNGSAFQTTPPPQA
jgi:hypothetical protein